MKTQNNDQLAEIAFQKLERALLALKQIGIFEIEPIEPLIFIGLLRQLKIEIDTDELSAEELVDTLVNLVKNG